MNCREAVDRSSQQILRRDAETLLLHVLGRDRAWLLAHGEEPLAVPAEKTLSELVAHRAAQVPLQYLTGRQEFFGLPLLVTPAVLIPRPETELLVEAVVDWARLTRRTGSGEALRMVDVGTGSGAIALALASELPLAEIQALDLSSEALQVAESNAARLGLERVRFLRSDLLEVQGEPIAEGLLDAVVSNPPYVPAVDAPTMQPEVRDHEPHLALFAGMDGLEIYRRLIPQAWRVLRSGGLLAMEFGFGQREALGVLLKGWAEVRFQDDYAGIPRIVMAEKP